MEGREDWLAPHILVPAAAQRILQHRERGLKRLTLHQFVLPLRPPAARTERLQPYT